MQLNNRSTRIVILIFRKIQVKSANKIIKICLNIFFRKLLPTKCQKGQKNRINQSSKLNNNLSKTYQGLDNAKAANPAQENRKYLKKCLKESTQIFITYRSNKNKILQTFVINYGK